jgi:hypothetical protein
MGKKILSILFALCGSVSFAQNINPAEISKFSIEGSRKQVKLAKEYSEKYALNYRGELEIVTIKEYPGKTKHDLWVKIQNWILSSSSNSQSSVQLMDETLGIIIERCFIPEIAKRSMGDNSYKVSIRPMLKFEFKDGRIRFTFSLQNYEVLKKNDDGGYGLLLSGGVVITGNGVAKDNMIWKLTECYPFKENYNEEVENDIFRPKVTSSRAYINTIACYKVLLDQMDEVINKVDEDNDDSNW